MQKILQLIAVLIIVMGLTACYPDEKISPVLGGDRDEHGCIGSAGYSWCEEKQKCLRIWEEPCNAELSDTIKQLFVDKYKKPLDEISVAITKFDDTHAKGDVKFGKNGIGEGGLFWAAKQDEKWSLVFDGNGIAPCRVFEPYDFPSDMVEGICTK